jgi:septation ring formation regulator EzrA
MAKKPSKRPPEELRDLMMQEFERTHGEIDQAKSELADKMDQGFERVDATLQAIHQTLREIKQTGDQTAAHLKSLRDFETAELHRRMDRVEKKLGIA